MKGASVNAKDKKVVVWGLGWSGVCAANLLVALGYRVSATDTRSADALEGALEALAAKGYALHSDVERILEQPHHHHGHDLVILTQSIKHHEPCVKEALAAGAHVMPEVELATTALRDRGVSVAAIGRTDGTTTTTKLAFALASAGRQAWVGGNSWPPLSSVALQVIEAENEGDLHEDAWVVAEVSAFQLPAWHGFRPNVGAVTNVAEDHVDEYFEGDFQRYIAAKRATVERLGEGEYAVLNADDPEVGAWAVAVEQAGAQVVYTSLSSRRVAGASHAYFVSNGEIRGRWEGQEFSLGLRSAFPLVGDHNTENLLTALAVTHQARAGAADTKAVIEGFEAPPHRLALVRRLDDVAYYDDSKATNTHASIAGLNAFGGTSIVPIVGGVDKGLDLDGWVQTLSAKARKTIVIGELRARLTGDYGQSLDLVCADSLEEAVALARRFAVPGDVVVLSPACSSFDMFSSYAERGRVFQSLVMALE